MARKNRVSVYDGVYHVTTRIANRAMLLKPDEVKERLMKWIVSVANFSGVEVWGFTVMDNHLHLIVHVPPVLEEYWLDPNEEPAAYAFGMRPPECRVPLWNGDSPSLGSLRIGDSPSPGSVASSAAVGPKEIRTSGDGDSPRRPPVGFMLDDAEMLARLRYLYSGKRVDDIAEEWARMRRNGLGNLVDERKRRYCRRMYNLSQYLKTLKEKVSMWYNDTYGHEGCLWQGRFYSGVIERKREVLAVVAAYGAYNPVKAGIAPSPDAWKWSSYSLAVNDAGEDGERCRRMYEAMFGQPWEEVRAILESIYADELPPGVTPEELKRWFDDYDEEAADKEGRPARVPPTYRASQAIRVSMKVFKTGAYISRAPSRNARETTAVTASKEGLSPLSYSHLCDSRESLVQVGKVAGATWASRWCNSGKSLVRLKKVAGATQESRWCDSGQSLVRLWRGAGSGRKKFQQVRTHRRS